MSQQGVVEIAKAQVIAYNDKNWSAATEALGPNVVYDEIGTRRRLTGPGQVIDAWKGWAAALPDSKATFDAAHVAGNTVILELTWRGTHRGPLQTPAGQIPATGKSIELRACQIVEVKDGKAQTVRHYFDMATMFAQLGVNPVGSEASRTRETTAAR
jgi:steroid delta-isomerase-like uncharacterized protein